MSPRRLGVAAATATALAALSAAPALADTSRGPSTSTNPYVLPVAPGAHVTSLFTVADDKAAGNGYEMVGIPDGLGAFRPSGNRFELLMNHELRQSQGVVRRHGANGAFVSRLSLNRRTLAVEAGEDFIDPGIRWWDYPSAGYAGAPSTGGPNPRQAADVFPAQLAQFSRFCSGFLSTPGQLHNRRSGRGYGGQVYFANEEDGESGRVFGVLEDGTAQQLPRLGLFAWENTLVASTRADSTVVLGNEDAATGQLWLYKGTKTKRGNAFDKAGLTNGVDFVIDALDESVTTDAEFRAKYPKGTAAEVDLAEVEWDQSIGAQNREAAADGLTLNRIEDGSFDPRRPNDYYFLTTEGGKGAVTPTGLTGRDGGGLWRLRFEDVDHPELGATLTLLLDGSEAPLLNKPDNMTIDRHGNLLIQEDPGNNVSVARIVAYQLESGRRGVVAQFDKALFEPKTAGGTDAELTIDEESSGIVDASDQLGRGEFLFDAQVHKAPAANATEYVEMGQLLRLHVPSFWRVYDIE